MPSGSGVGGLREGASPTLMLHYDKGAMQTTLPRSQHQSCLIHTSANRITSTVLARVDAEPPFLSVAEGKWEGISPLCSPPQCRQGDGGKRLHHLSTTIIFQAFGYQANHITDLIHSTLT